MSTSRLASTTLAILALLPFGSSAAPADATLRVEITNLRSTQGEVGCLIFNSPDGYPETRTKAYKTLRATIEGGHALCEFKNVAPGTYAAIIGHDENRNGKVDKNFIGAPREGYAASNNVRHKMSAPGFQEASFAVPAGAVTSINVQVGY